MLDALAAPLARGRVREDELHAAITDVALPARLYGALRAQLDELEVAVVAEDDAEDTERPDPGFNQDGLTTFLGQAGRHRVLTAADERHLAAIISKGALAKQWLDTGRVPPDAVGDLTGEVRAGERAKNEFASCNIKLVASIAGRLQGRGLELDDLIQEGYIGLMTAVAKFDGTRGYKFSTYATWWIRQAMERAIANTGSTIRLPVHLHERVARYGRLRRRLVHELGRRPTDEELCQSLQVSAVELREIQRAGQMRTASLDRAVSDDLTLRDLVEDVRPSPERLAEVADFGRRIGALLAGLSEREREVMFLRYGLDGRVRTLEEVGQRFNVTRERIRQLEAKALVELRGVADAELRAFIDCWPEPPDGESAQSDPDAAVGVGHGMTSESGDY